MTKPTHVCSTRHAGRAALYTFAAGCALFVITCASPTDNVPPASASFNDPELGMTMTVKEGWTLVDTLSSPTRAYIGRDSMEYFGYQPHVLITASSPPASANIDTLMEQGASAFSATCDCDSAAIISQDRIAVDYKEAGEIRVIWWRGGLGYRTKQILIVNNDYLIVVSCSVAEGQYAAVLNDFESMLDSIEL